MSVAVYVCASGVLLTAAHSRSGLQVEGTPPQACANWQECRALALEAETRRDLERFHDLAWRTMQTRGKSDPEVMVLLARAQASSGRPHDALVMLRRIAEMGVAPAEALTADVFARTRALPDWPSVGRLIGEAAAGRAAAAPSGAASTPGPAGTLDSRRVPRQADADLAKKPGVAAKPAADAPGSTSVATPTPRAPGQADAGLRFDARNIVVAGLAYDAASGRVLVGNRRGRSVITISEHLKTSMDLVRAKSAGFQDVFALVIDERRGDLWVASAAPGEEGGGKGAALHKLQLVSGRPLTRVDIDTDGRPARFVALAATATGAIWALDGNQGRLWRLDPGASTAVLAHTLDEPRPSAMTVESAERAYVAYEGGIGRLTLASGEVTPLTVTDGVDVSRLEALSSHRGSLVAVQRGDDGSRRVVRLRLSSRGTSVRGWQVLDEALTICGGAPALTISKGVLYYLAGEAAPGERSCAVRRMTLH